VQPSLGFWAYTTTYSFLLTLLPIFSDVKHF
jgi:hypothetical protein